MIKFPVFVTCRYELISSGINFKGATNISSGSLLCLLKYNLYGLTEVLGYTPSPLLSLILEDLG